MRQWPCLMTSRYTGPQLETIDLLWFLGTLFGLESQLRTDVKTELEESVDQSVANLNVTVRQILASHWSKTVK